MHLSEDHVATLAQKIIDDLLDEDDLTALAERVAEAARLDPQLIAQVVLTLAAWVPNTDTTDDRVKRVLITAVERRGIGRRNLTTPGAAA